MNILNKTILTLTGLVMLSACASHPNTVPASYVSPIKYDIYSCEQISTEMDTIARKTISIYSDLVFKSNADTLEMGIGIIFWPALLMLDGGDGALANEYAILKGEFKALEDSYINKQCTFTYQSPEDIFSEQEETRNKEREIRNKDKKEFN